MKFYNKKTISKILIIILISSPIIVNCLKIQSSKAEVVKMNKGKQILLSMIASLPYASGAIRQHDIIELERQLSAYDSKLKDLYLKIEKFSGERQKMATLDAIGQIKLLAGTGSIEINGAALEALNRITVNSEQSFIWVDGAKIKASRIRLSSETGGELNLTDTTSESKGTRIDIGKGAQIKIKGNARIDQN